MGRIALARARARGEAMSTCGDMPYEHIPDNSPDPVAEAQIPGAQGPMDYVEINARITRLMARRTEYTMRYIDMNGNVIDIRTGGYSDLDSAWFTAPPPPKPTMNPMYSKPLPLP